MDIEIIRGTSKNIRLSLTDEAGNNYAPRPGDVAVFGVKRLLSSKELVITKKAEVQEDGTALFTLLPEDTAELCCDKYFYDVGLETGDEFYIVIPATTFRIKNNVTFRGCTK